LLRKERAMDVFDFAQFLRFMDDVLVTALVATMFIYMAYPRLKRMASRVRVKTNPRDKYYRGYRG
jgi:hypothetical protein